MATSSLRRDIILKIAEKQPVAQDSDLVTFDITRDYGSDVFNDEVMKKILPKTAYDAVRRAVDQHKFEIMDPAVADAVANAMRIWAIEKGATHYTHWFQPMTGSTAEKHDGFIANSVESGCPLLRFRGSELTRGEPDASSFPHGGVRSTFEARGYTAWDPSSPAFIRRSKNGNTLLVPTAFCSWTGVALDKKTPMLRSEKAVDREATKMCRLLGLEGVKSVGSYIGIEQEFFLIDRDFYLARPDLVATGRTLVGARPPKGQQLEDHYFGTIHPRVIALIQECEKKLWRLGVPTKTRHNEVAPGQWEMAPIFERSTLANDHNILIMDTLRETARKHGFECVLHEKPFAGVNGSGKHNNWSLIANTGENMFEPGDNPKDNMRFMMFLAACCKAVDDHADLLRASVASPSNDFRLGGNEAPPAIISIFIGSQLEDAIKTFIGAPVDVHPDFAPFVQLGVSLLPKIPRDTTDRNRTSPFAFTGNKFEFRSVGSSQTCGRPITAVNAAMADALAQMNAAVEAKLNAKMPLTQAVTEVCAETLKQHHRIIFNGDGYSKEWRDEAVKRGLKVYAQTPESIEAYDAAKNLQMWEDVKVMSKVEAHSRTHIQLENYIKSVQIEAKMLDQIASTMILPASNKYQESCAKSINDAAIALKDDSKLAEQRAHLLKVVDGVSSLTASINALRKACKDVEAIPHNQLQAIANANRDLVRPAMLKVRELCDSLEEMVDDVLWPLPKYSEMMFYR